MGDRRGQEAGEGHCHHHQEVQGTQGNGGAWKSDRDAKVGARREAGAQRAGREEAQNGSDLMACMGEVWLWPVSDRGIPCGSYFAGMALEAARSGCCWVERHCASEVPKEGA